MTIETPDLDFALGYDNVDPDDADLSWALHASSRDLIVAGRDVSKISEPAFWALTRFLRDEVSTFKSTYAEDLLRSSFKDGEPRVAFVGEKVNW